MDGLAQHIEAAVVARKLAAVAAELGPLARKTADEGFGYLAAETLYDAARPLLARHGLWLLPSITHTTTDRAGQGYLTTVQLELRWICTETGASLVQLAHGQGVDTHDRGAPKAATAALKYGLSRALLVGAGVDLETPARPGAREVAEAAGDISGPPAGTHPALPDPLRRPSPPPEVRDPGPTHRDPRPTHRDPAPPRGAPPSRPAQRTHPLVPAPGTPEAKAMAVAMVQAHAEAGEPLPARVLAAARAAVEAGHHALAGAMVAYARGPVAWGRVYPDVAYEVAGVREVVGRELDKFAAARGLADASAKPAPPEPAAPLARAAATPKPSPTTPSARNRRARAGGKS